MNFGPWTLIAAVNEEGVLKDNLLRSPDIDNLCQVILKRGFDSVGKAYNSAISEATSEILVFVHQDVYLPAGWLAELYSVLRQLESCDPEWGALGVFGIATTGRAAGHVYATGLNAMLGSPFAEVIPTGSLDEMLLITRRSSGLRFDDCLPGFHLYGTDICLEARRKGLSSYIIPALCVHNSNGKRILPMAFWKSYLYMRRKWWDQLPVATCCAELSRSCWWPMMRALKSSYNRIVTPVSDPIGYRTPDVEALWKDLNRSVGTCS